jgi:hypothetical protein
MVGFHLSERGVYVVDNLFGPRVRERGYLVGGYRHGRLIGHSLDL